MRSRVTHTGVGRIRLRGPLAISPPLLLPPLKPPAFPRPTVSLRTPPRLHLHAALSSQADVAAMFGGVSVLSGPADALRRGEFAGIYEFADRAVSMSLTLTTTLSLSLSLSLTLTPTRTRTRTRTRN